MDVFFPFSALLQQSEVTETDFLLILNFCLWLIETLTVFFESDFDCHVDKSVEMILYASAS